MIQPSEKSIITAENHFRKSGGVMRTSEALAAGIQPRTLYWMRDQGILDLLSRGVFHLRTHPLPRNPDAVAVLRRVPRAILCLVSALDFHNIGTHIPTGIQIALPSGTKTPRIKSPKVEVYRMGTESLKEGVERHDLDGGTVPVFSPAKTIADCFKFRNKVGLDIAIEALREAIDNRICTPGEIMRFAKTNRVESVIRPYLEALQ